VVTRPTEALVDGAPVHAGGVVPTGAGGAMVHLQLATGPVEARRAVARVTRAVRLVPTDAAVLARLLGARVDVLRYGWGTFCCQNFYF
jgi:hypothetical protein